MASVADIRTVRPSPRVALGPALNQSQDIVRAFEDLQADVIRLAALLSAAEAQLSEMDDRITALETP